MLWAHKTMMLWLYFWPPQWSIKQQSVAPRRLGRTVFSVHLAEMETCRWSDLSIFMYSKIPNESVGEKQRSVLLHIQWFFTLIEWYLKHQYTLLTANLLPSINCGSKRRNVASTHFINRCFIDQPFIFPRFRYSALFIADHFAGRPSSDRLSVFQALITTILTSPRLRFVHFQIPAVISRLRKKVCMSEIKLGWRHPTSEFDSVREWNSHKETNLTQNFLSAE